MNRELLRETVAELRNAGIEPTIKQSRHFKVTWRDHQGRPRCLVISVSPSSRYARARNRAQLRRLLARGNQL